MAALNKMLLLYHGILSNCLNNGFHYDCNCKITGANNKFTHYGGRGSVVWFPLFFKDKYSFGNIKISDYGGNIHKIFYL